MSRYTIHRVDRTQDAIVNALVSAGFRVWTRLPVDLLTWRADKGFIPIECKPPKDKENNPRIRKGQARQAAFLKETGTPVVVTPEQALRAVGLA